MTHLAKRLRSGWATGCAALLFAGLAPVAAQPSLHATLVYGIGLDDQTQHLVALNPTRGEPEAASVALGDTLRDPWLGRDKVLHAAGSFLLTLSAQYVLTSKLDTSEGGALRLAAMIGIRPESRFQCQLWNRPW